MIFSLLNYLLNIYISLYTSRSEEVSFTWRCFQDEKCQSILEKLTALDSIAVLGNYGIMEGRVESNKNPNVFLKTK